MHNQLLQHSQSATKGIILGNISKSLFSALKEEMIASVDNKEKLELELQQIRRRCGSLPLRSLVIVNFENAQTWYNRYVNIQ